MLNNVKYDVANLIKHGYNIQTINKLGYYINYIEEQSIPYCKNCYTAMIDIYDSTKSSYVYGLIADNINQMVKYFVEVEDTEALKKMKDCGIIDNVTYTNIIFKQLKG